MRKTNNYTIKERQEQVKACYEWTRQGNTIISYCKEHGVSKSAIEY